MKLLPAQRQMKDYVPRNKRRKNLHRRDTEFFDTGGRSWRGAYRTVPHPGWEICHLENGMRIFREYTKKHNHKVVRIEARSDLPEGITENPHMLDLDELLLLQAKQRERKPKEPLNTASPDTYIRNSSCPPTCSAAEVGCPTPQPSQEILRRQQNMGSLPTSPNNPGCIEKPVKVTKWKTVKVTKKIRVKKKRMVPNPNYRPKKKRRKLPPWPRVEYQRRTDGISNQPNRLTDLAVDLSHTELRAFKATYGHKEKKHPHAYISTFGLDSLVLGSQKLKTNLKSGLLHLGPDGTMQHVIAAKSDTVKQQSKTDEAYKLQQKLKVFLARGRRIEGQLTSFKKLHSELKTGNGKLESSGRSTPNTQSPPRETPQASERESHSSFADEVHSAHEQYQEAVDITIGALQRSMARLLETKRLVGKSEKLRKQANTYAQLLRSRRCRAEKRLPCDQMIRSLISRDVSWQKFKERVKHDPFAVSA